MIEFNLRYTFMINELRKLKGLNFYAAIFFIFITIGFLWQYSSRVYSLISRNYIIYESDIYEIGTFKIQGRAYEYGSGKNSTPRFEFNSIDGYSFTIGHSVFQAIIDKAELRDTLMYHESQFKVYSDKKTYENYTKSATPIYIEVLQIQYGEKKYIDINKANQIEKRALIRQAVGGLVLLFFIILALFKYDEFTENKKALAGAIFLTVMILILLL
jgi:hypothetical protein